MNNDMYKLLEMLIKLLIMTYDADGTLLSWSFAKDDKTEYHIVKKQYLDDKWIYGTEEHPYEEGESNDQ